MILWFSELQLITFEIRNYEGSKLRHLDNMCCIRESRRFLEITFVGLHVLTPMLRMSREFVIYRVLVTVE